MNSCLSSLGQHPASQWLTHRVCLLLGWTVHVGGQQVVPLRPLGEGGFSVVFLCADPSGARYALKKSITQDPDELVVANREVALLRRLEHKNIVRFYGAETVQLPRGRTEVYVLMEHCGQSVLRMMQDRNAQGGRFTELEVIHMFGDLAEAVAYLHSQDPPVAHRDVKVDNLLRASGGTFKLCDFGSCITHAYQPVGSRDVNYVQEEIDKATTPQYRAPEMCDLFSGKRIDEKVDDWALGCVLFYLCFFDLPFGESKLQILNARWRFPEEPCPEAFKTIITQCLQPDPAARWDAWAVLQHLATLPSRSSAAPTRPDPPVPQPLFQVPA